MGTQALIGLGSNLGDRKALLDSAIVTLSHMPGVVVNAASTYHETAAVGGPEGQGAFLNAAASLETTLEPEALLDVLLAIEQNAGRVRTVPWGARTLDLDLLLYGDRMIATERLRVPHPWMALRRFVLAPLADIAPEAVDPLTGLTIRGLLANLDRRPSYVAFAVPSYRFLRVPRAVQEQARSKMAPPLYLPLIRALAAVPIAMHARREALADPEMPGGLTEELERAETRFFARVWKLTAWDETLQRAVLDRLVSDSPIAETTIETVARHLDRATWSPSEWGERWLVSPFCLDAMFLALHTVETSCPRERVLVEQFLETRSHVLAPTFVVARRGDKGRLPIQNRKFAWHWPIGRDTPILWVHDFESDAALDQILAACAATRSG